MQRKKEEGFTLIESLTAMLILIVALLPALAVTGSVLDVSADIQNNLIGALLAQEGIELIHALRDYNWLKCNDFSTGLVGGPFLVDIDTEWVDCNPARSLALATPTNPYLNLDQSTGIYGYGVGAPTKFRRTVTITQVSANELRVIAEVTWTTKDGATLSGCATGQHCVRTEAHLYNWK